MGGLKKGQKSSDVIYGRPPRHFIEYLTGAKN